MYLPKYLPQFKKLQKLDSFPVLSGDIRSSNDDSEEMTSCALGCFTNRQTVFFDIPYSKKQKLCTLRASRWKAALKNGQSRSSQNTRVCSEHFFLKEPAAVEDLGNPDWVPWLKLNPKNQDDPVQVQQRMQQYYEQRATFSKKVCCIGSCPNNKEKVHQSTLYDFPALDTSSYTRRVLSERRLLAWIEVIQQPDLWNKFDIHTLKICGMHFMNGKVADLTDVENVDWIPTRRLSRPVNFTDHVAHFDLYSIASLASGGAECDVQEETPLDLDDDDDDMDQLEEEPVMVAASQPPPVAVTQPKPQVNVGFKCILCLGNAALKPLTPVDQLALDEFFKDKLCVKSELICKKCCKNISDFHAFHMSILKIQDGAVSRKIKNIIPVLDPKPADAVKKKAEGLFTVCSPDKFQCSICSAVLVGKDLLNKHLYVQHKIKIMCKICKTSFTPEGYTAHRLTCGPPRPAQGKGIPLVKNQPPKASIIPVGLSNSKEKYSCYICTQFFTPDEMKEHIKTHDDLIKAGGVRSRVHAQVVFDDNFEACKRCSKAIHKNDKEKHQRQHDEERERLKQLIAKQKASNAHRCVPCNMSFPTEDQLQKHRTVHKVLTCSECNEEYGKKYQLTNHRRSAHGIKASDDSTTNMVECSDCNSLVNASSLKVHLALEHDSSPIACEMCGKEVFQIALLKHQESFCNDDNPSVPCTICSNTMPASVVKEHVEAVHVQSKQLSHKERIQPKPSEVTVNASGDQVNDLIEEDFVEEEHLEDEFQPEQYVASAFK